MRRHKIIAITPGSIGDSLELQPGDFLLEIDGMEIKDVFDYRMAVASEELTVLIEKSVSRDDITVPDKMVVSNKMAAPDDMISNCTEPELWELDIEKGEHEDLGLIFETALMDEVRTCQNRCIFCFIDQQPPGLRPSLYVKDDDIRLSFLHGNYVTLTNIDDTESARIARHHLSPLRISVHTVNANLRCHMTGNKNAGNLTAHLQRFAAAGIEMHFQAVLCKGYNDGARLDETIAGLLKYRPQAQSLAIVPAGLTHHRDGYGEKNALVLPEPFTVNDKVLTPLKPFTAEEAAAVIKQVEAWQERCRATYGTAFVFAADEWYVLAGRTPPSAEACEDFPQLENGVGMVGLFEYQFKKQLSEATTQTKKQPERYSAHHIGHPTRNTGYPAPYIGHHTHLIGIATGAAAFNFMCALTKKFETHHPGTCIRVYKIINHFFGESVTVSGLLTGGDIIAQMREQCDGLDILFLPANAFRAGTQDMLDGTTRADVEAALGIPVRISSTDGGEFCRMLVN